jgi:hypothetical protein
MEGSVGAAVQIEVEDMEKTTEEPCQHEVDPLVRTFDTYPASYGCKKCGRYFQKPEDVEEFRRQMEEHT